MALAGAGTGSTVRITSILNCKGFLYGKNENGIQVQCLECDTGIHDLQRKNGERKVSPIEMRSVMIRQQKILFLQGASFCYDSAVHFERCISAEFEKLGWKAEHIACSPEKAVSILKTFYGESYDIIFDINSILPSLRDQDGEFCLNRIQGQVWHYILDHPFYHHDVLKCRLNNFCVICLDEKHAEFIRKYYPHIKKVLCLPLAAVQAKEQIPYQERKHEVVFTGTYTDSDLILYQTMKQTPEKKKLFEQSVQLLLDEPELTQEEAVACCGNSDNIGLLLKENYLIDMYLRACLREELLVILLKHGISVTVYGHNWEEFLEKCRGRVPEVENYLQITGEVSYGELPDLYADTKIALNQLPWFKAGMHDRIPMALMNGCVCVTDGSLYLEKCFQDGRELYFYSLENMEGAAEIVRGLLKNNDTAAETAMRGYSYAQKKLSWENWIKAFLHYGIRG